MDIRIIGLLSVIGVSVLLNSSAGAMVSLTKVIVRGTEVLPAVSVAVMVTVFVPSGRAAKVVASAVHSQSYVIPPTVVGVLDGVIVSSLFPLKLIFTLSRLPSVAVPDSLNQ